MRGPVIACSAAVIALACLLAPPVGARDRTRRAHHTATFAGSCQLTGTVTFEPPLTATFQPTRDYALEQGTCSGSLTSHGHRASVNDEAARYFATDFGSAASCAGSTGATGWGVLSVRRTNIYFGLSESRVSGVAHLTLSGTAGGSAQGVASISSSANPAQIAEECAGPGLHSAPIDISLQTMPSISG